MADNKVIRIYTMPQEMPCGPDSSCCGPIGQSETELAQMRREIELTIPGAPVEVVNIRQTKLSAQRDASVLKVIQMFGPAALPVIAVAGEVVSIGPAEPDQLGPALRAKFAPAG